MKKLIAILMALVLALTFVACSKGGDEDKDTSADSGASVESSVEDTSEAPAPVTVDIGFGTVVVPVGYSYTTNVYAMDEKDGLHSGSIDLNLKDDETGATPALELTTGHQAKDQAGAVEHTIGIYNVDQITNGKATVEDELTFGNYAFTPIHIEGEDRDEYVYVTLANRGEDVKGVIVRFKLSSASIDDEKVVSLLSSLSIENS